MLATLDDYLVEFTAHVLQEFQQYQVIKFVNHCLQHVVRVFIRSLFSGTFTAGTEGWMSSLRANRDAILNNLQAQECVDTMLVESRLLELDLIIELLEMDISLETLMNFALDKFMPAMGKHTYLCLKLTLNLRADAAHLEDALDFETIQAQLESSARLAGCLEPTIFADDDFVGAVVRGISKSTAIARRRGST